MSDPSEQPTEVLGQAGEACAACGAPLAVDQRYCLNCGRRRAGPRVDFRSHLATSTQPPPAPANGRSQGPPAEQQRAVPPTAEGRPDRDYTPLAAVGGIAVLGLMLLVGVLIGKENNSATTSAPPPVVVRGGEAETGKEEATGTGAGKAKPKATKKENAASAAKPAQKAENAESLTKAGAGSGPVEASDTALEELEKSPDYSKESAKLPDEIATGGAPPPEDGKDPGGGSKGTAIE